MPDVTVPESPSGAPIATTGWPTCRDADVLSAMTLSLPGFWTLSTARSVCGSRPVIVAGLLFPSENCTSTEPPSVAAMEMTWLLVRM